MTQQSTVASHYANRDLIAAIEAALPKLGLTQSTVNQDDLAAIDEFHIGGRQATEHLLGRLNFPNNSHILDVGCGLGGAARHTARRHSSTVTGIDLTRDFIQTGIELNRWLGMEKQVSLSQQNAVSMAFENETFDGGYMLHVGMNIEDKVKLCAEIYRVLRPGARFGIYDPMRGASNVPLDYPLPWAIDSKSCALASCTDYQHALKSAGFTRIETTDRRDFALRFLNELSTKIRNDGGPASLGLHIIMQKSAAEKTHNILKNLTENRLTLTEIIVQKPWSTLRISV